MAYDFYLQSEITYQAVKLMENLQQRTISPLFVMHLNQAASETKVLCTIQSTNLIFRDPNAVIYGYELAIFLFARSDSKACPMLSRVLGLERLCTRFDVQSHCRSRIPRTL
jgi:hypothetical protein